MKISLKSFNDLGKCSYGTLKEVFDTEKEEIYFNKVKVEINGIYDLEWFLWANPSVVCGAGGKTKAYFYGNELPDDWFDCYLRTAADHFTKAYKLKDSKCKDEQKKAEKILYYKKAGKNWAKTWSSYFFKKEEILKKLREENDEH